MERRAAATLAPAADALWDGFLVYAVIRRNSIPEDSWAKFASSVGQLQLDENWQNAIIL